MANSLNVAAMLGSAAAAFQEVQFLYTTIDNIRDAPGFLHDIKLDIQAVKDVLHNLVTAAPSDSSQIISSAEVKSAVENCCKLCTDLQALVTRWKRRAVEEDTFWVHRWRVSLSGEERIRVFKGQLNLCKDTLAVALSTATSITKLRNQEDTMKEIKEMMLKQNVTVLQKEISRANGEKAETESSLLQVSIGDSNWLSEEFKQSRLELLQDIRQQQTFNDAFRRMCEQALAITMSERTGHKAEGVQKTTHSPALVEFINTSAEETLTDYNSSEIIPGSGGFEVSERAQDAYHAHILTHMCCLMLGVLDIVSPDIQQTHYHPGLDLSSESNQFCPEQTEYSPMVGAQGLQPELALLPQDPITPTIHPSDSQPQEKEKPVCWEHGCQGRLFSSWSNLRRHQREKARQEPACYCPRCGAYFSRTSSRDQHLANMSCTRIRRYSNGRVRPNHLKIQESLDTQL